MQQAQKVPKCYSFDGYAAQLLERMVPNSRSHGAFLSALVLAEAARRGVQFSQAEPAPYPTPAPASGQ